MSAREAGLPRIRFAPTLHGRVPRGDRPCAPRIMEGEGQMQMMENMMSFMMGSMSKEDKEEMMESMMGKMVGDMSPEERMNMMTAMMPK
jgi:hypothetical protein